jgi:peroxiredoxin
MRVGDKPEPDQTVRLQNRYDRYYEPGNRSSGLSLYLKAEPDEAGNFVFEKVPPGRRLLYVEYRFKERQYGETPLSHGLPLAVEPGATLDVTLGGAGRKVVGRVKVIGGDVTDVDWRRDVHRLTLILPPEPSLQQPDMSKATTPDAQQRAWQEFNQRQREFWRTDAGRARELSERNYVLVFDTNGGFRVENVPPGKYMLSITANDPEEEYYRQRTIGNVNKQIEVPDTAGAKANEPFEIGTLEMTIRGKLKIGKPAPPLETKTVDGKPISLADFRGKLVLLYFYMSQMSAGSIEFKILKELHDSYGKEEKLVILGLSLDPSPQAAGQFAKANGMDWMQAHLGEWGQTQVPATFGVEGIPTAILIDSQGRLAARNLRGSSMRTAVRNALSAKAGAAEAL